MIIKLKQFLKSCVFLSLLFGISWGNGHAQLTVQGGQTGAQLANILSGGGVTISNVQLNCPNSASGTFDGTMTNLGIGQGVLLTSGAITIAAQPQVSGGEGQDNFSAGDADLTLLSGVQTFDACALEFDIVATCDTISIAYVFGSEEYDEFVCAGVNDAFGFFISGFGIPAGTNIATVPGTGDPVSINTVNNGSVGIFGFNGPGCILTNSGFYTSNAVGTTHEYDAQTVRMEAKSWVQPCSTYHIKLVVADGGDGILDSGVFLEENGIRCASAQITVNTATVNGSNYVVEGCTDAVLYFERQGNLSQSYTVHYTVGGTAINGTDYNQIADSVVFAVGQDSVGITINAVNDGNTEGLEEILIILVDSVCGAQFSDTAVIPIIDPPVADFSAVDACPNFDAQFSDQSQFPFGNITNWDWDFGDGGTSNTQNPMHPYSNPGTYSVQLVITTAEGCQDSITQTITIHEEPTADFDHIGFCAGHPTDFTDLSTTNGTNTLSTWDWDFDDGNGSVNQNPSHVYFVPGIYNVTLIISNNHGCNDTIVQPVEIFDAPQPEFDWQDVCNGQEMNFVDQSNIASGTITGWIWNMGDGTTYNVQNVNHTYADTGTYVVQLTVTSSWGCIDSVSHTVTVHPNPEPDFDVSFACLGDTSFFTDLSTIGSGNIVAWDWDFGNGNTSNQQNPWNIYTVDGQYTVTLTVTSDNGCTTTMTRTLPLPPRPTKPVPTHDTVCGGFSATLGAAASPGAGTVEWLYSANSTLPFHTGYSYQTGPINVHTVYYIEVVSDDGCRSGPVAVHAYVNDPPNILVTVSSYELEIPNAIVEFYVNNQNLIASWFWDFGDGTTSTQAQPVHEYTEEGEYFVTLRIIDHNGCERIYHLKEIVVTQDIRILLPNAFTPNGDGLNDEFFATSTLITDLEIEIFDRWGKLIYRSEDLNFRWNGRKAEGDAWPEGAYVYKVRAVGYDGSIIRKSGTVTILR